MTPSVPIAIIRDAVTQIKEAIRLLDKAVEREMGKEQCTHEYQWATHDGTICKMCGKLENDK